MQQHSAAGSLQYGKHVSPVAPNRGAAAALCALLIAIAVSAAPAVDAADAVPAEALRDHLKCYRIDDSLRPVHYLADLRNQFGIEPGCRIQMPARLLCVETSKHILPPPAPPGGGPITGGAGDFLCYAIRCPLTDAPAAIEVEDQFGRRRVAIDQERLLCAPADLSMCGDGDLDPGEECDAPETTCAAPCKADCTCDFSNCCQCEDSCSQGFFCPVECPPIAGGLCSPSGRCAVPCPCGVTCTTLDGVVGSCRPAAGSTECLCQPPPPPRCPCGATCVTADGSAGRCAPTASGACQCRRSR